MREPGEPSSDQPLDQSLELPLEQQIADLRVRLQMQRQLIAIKLIRRPGKRRFRYPRSTVMRFLMRHPTMTLNLLTRMATLLVNATVLRPRKPPHERTEEEQEKA
ncbi:MAG: hypothetical protein Q7V56_06415 [Gammaproteobacteria bacterium]|nr:hypothetical protein [Gammaproteobacteria bacterium]